MPTVETYGQQKVTTQVARAPTLNTPRVADTASPIVAGLKTLAAGIESGRDRMIETQAEEALVNFEREKNELFFNPESGYFNSQGKTAFDGAEGISKSLDELQLRYSDSLESQEAKTLFKRATDSHITRGRASIQEHASKGMDAYELATIKSRVENSIENAAYNFNNDDEITLNNVIGMSAIADQADRLGLDGQAKAEMIQSYNSQFAAALITASAQHDISRANNLFEKNKHLLEGKDLLTVTENMEKLNFDSKVLDEVSSIVSDGSRSLKDMVNDVNNLPLDTPEQAKVKTEVMRQVKNEYTLNKLMKEEQEREIYENFGKQVQDGAIKVSQIPASYWNGMTVSQRESLQKLEKVFMSGDSVTTDDVLLTNLLLLPKDELSKISPVWYFDRVGGADRDKLTSAVLSARKPGKEDTYSAMRTGADRSKTTMRRIMGKPTKDYNKEQLEQHNAIATALQYEIQIAESEKGRRLYPNELDDIHNSFALKTFKERSYWVDKTLTMKDVPAKYIPYIQQQLRANSIPVNSVNIINAYQENEEYLEQQFGSD